MTSFGRCLLLAALVQAASLSQAQQPTPVGQPQSGAGQNSRPLRPREEPTEAAAETLHTQTQLVVVDVVVEDKSGHPVHGLTRDNFVITEQKEPQTIRNFEEHSAASDQKPGPAPRLPRGVFTDYTPIAPNSTLNVLLIDALNTPDTDQIYLRQQLLNYIKREKPGTNVAIFGLANRLVMLQGFTTDPVALRTAVDHLDNRKSPLLLDPIGTGVGPQTMSDLMVDHPQDADPQMVANLKQWEAEQAALKTHMRAQFTLDAFNTIGHYLSNFSGRKNLIWFSGSFPLQIAPDSSLKDPFGVMADSNQELRETTNLLWAAQIAVYPVDARGLMTAPAFDLSQSGRYIAPKAADFTNDLLKFGQNQADEHITMEKMADDTGGHAFYNTNDLAEAVASAIDAGSNYYTLTYTPTDHRRNSAYRTIHVEITGSATAQGAKLAYRHGYYGDYSLRPSKRKGDDVEMNPALAAPTVAPAVAVNDAYSRAAISHGAPTPGEIFFKVRVRPINGKNDTMLAPGNQANPHGKMKPPYRTFAVDYVALPGSFSMTSQSDGRHAGAIEFGVFVYDANGNLLNISDKQVSLNLPPETYQEFVSDAVRIQLQVSAPVRQESFLRLVIQDIPTHRYGAVEIPTSQVGNLPPLEAQILPANSPAPGSGATPQSNRKQ